VALELDLLVVHGVLHLTGWDDHEPEAARLMHEQERQILTCARRQAPSRLWAGLLEA
jgi:rRNA maturation RNase YbeY